MVAVVSLRPSMKEDDYIQHLIVTSSHATVLCFTNVGKVYRLKVLEVPQASRGAKGRPMVNLLPVRCQRNHYCDFTCD